MSASVRGISFNLIPDLGTRTKLGTQIKSFCFVFDSILYFRNTDESVVFMANIANLAPETEKNNVFIYLH